MVNQTNLFPIDARKCEHCYLPLEVTMLTQHAGMARATEDISTKMALSREHTSLKLNSPFYLHQIVLTQLILQTNQ